MRVPLRVERSSEFTGAGLARNLALAQALKPIAARHGTTVASVAVAWTLAWPAVTGAIVGARHYLLADIGVSHGLPD